MKDIVVIVGPTGVGKTKLSIELAKRIDAEILNADSMQVYRGADIGTAKVKEEEMDGVVHHLLDIADIEQMYTAYHYQKQGRDVIASILARGKKVIIVGGTGLYIKALLYDYQFLEEQKHYDFSTWSDEKLFSEVKKQDPKTSIHPHNRKRLERFLQRSYNHAPLQQKTQQKLFDFSIVGLTTSRDNLYRRINDRVEEMIRDGLVEEVEEFYQKGIRSKAILTGIGYKELYQYFDGNISFEDAISLIQKNSRHYAKRQYTFFNHQFDVAWFETNYENFTKTIEEVYHHLIKE